MDSVSRDLSRAVRELETLSLRLEIQGEKNDQTGVWGLTWLFFVRRCS